MQSVKGKVVGLGDELYHVKIAIKLSIMMSWTAGLSLQK